MLPRRPPRRYERRSCLPLATCGPSPLYLEIRAPVFESFRRILVLGVLPAGRESHKGRWTSTRSSSCSSGASTTRSASSRRPSSMLRQVLEKDDASPTCTTCSASSATRAATSRRPSSTSSARSRINPNYTEAALNLAVTYNDRGKYEAARQVYARIKGRPRRHAARARSVRARQDRQHARRGRAGIRRRRTRARGDRRIREGRRAVPAVRRPADASSGSSFARSTTSRAPASNTRRPSLARPSYVPARIQLGVTLLSLGESDAAAEQWRKVLELEPENARAKMYLRIMASARNPSTPPPAE